MSKSIIEELIATITLEEVIEFPLAEDLEVKYGMKFFYKFNTREEYNKRIEEPEATEYSYLKDVPENLLILGLWGGLVLGFVTTDEQNRRYFNYIKPDLGKVPIFEADLDWRFVTILEVIEYGLRERMIANIGYEQNMPGYKQGSWAKGDLHSPYDLEIWFDYVEQIETDEIEMEEIPF